MVHQFAFSGLPLPLYSLGAMALWLGYGGGAAVQIEVVAIQS